MLVRSNTGSPAKISGSSGNSGPENDFSATVVSTTGTWKPLAALPISATLLRRAEMSMVWVANAICDWWSIRIRAWSFGDSRDLPGTAVAVVIGGAPGVVRRKTWQPAAHWPACCVR